MCLARALGILFLDLHACRKQRAVTACKVRGFGVCYACCPVIETVCLHPFSILLSGFQLCHSLGGGIGLGHLEFGLNEPVLQACSTRAEETKLGSRSAQQITFECMCVCIFICVLYCIMLNFIMLHYISSYCIVYYNLNFVTSYIRSCFIALYTTVYYFTFCIMYGIIFGFIWHFICVFFHFFSFFYDILYVAYYTLITVYSGCIIWHHSHTRTFVYAIAYYALQNIINTIVYIM